MSDQADFPVAILAGGLATRLWPMTETIPKSLVKVAGRPFLEHQLGLLHRNGIRRAVLCVGHLGGMIRDVFGDGSAYGLRLDYSFDGERLLGTGGALRKALPLLGDDFFVPYGDSYLPVDYAQVREAYRASGMPGLMTVFKNEERWDTSNVEFEAGRIKVYDKVERTPRMLHIDYGLSILSARTVAEGVPDDESSDLARLFANLVDKGELAGYEVNERFYEIGSPSGLAELDALLAAGRL